MIPPGAPLLALPGTLLDARSLLRVLGAWPGGNPPRVELLGEAETFDDEIERLERLLPAGSAAWVMGHSLGGIVALHLAQRHPHRVAGLLLLAANARAGIHTNAERRAAQWALARSRGLRALATDKLGGGYDLVAGDPLIERLADQAEAVGLRRFERQLRYAATRPGVLQTPGLAPLPMLLLSADRDRLCPPAHSDEIARAVPGARHDVLHGGSHLFPMQQPDWVAARLRSFLGAGPPAQAQPSRPVHDSRSTR